MIRPTLENVDFINYLRHTRRNIVDLYTQTHMCKVQYMVNTFSVWLGAS